MTGEEAEPGTAARASAGLRAFAAYGLELEYMIVSGDTLDVAPLADRAFEMAGAPFGSGDVPRGALGWSNELVAHVVELKNVCPQPLGDLPTSFQQEIRRFDGLLASVGARLMPGAMHPWMDPVRDTRLWRHGNATVYEAYDRIFGCRAHGWANLQSTHVNLPFADDAEFERLHAAVRIALPLIPALAASSPYAEARAPGPLDYRMHVYASNSSLIPSITGAVVPETVTSRAEYESRVLQPMYRDIAPLDPDGVLRHEWLNSRGAIARFSRNAIEIRVMDVQDCPLADVAIAALVVDLVRALYDGRYAPLDRQQAVAVETLARVLNACIRDGERAVIADEGYLAVFGIGGGPLEAAALWRRIADRLEAWDAAHLGLWAAPVDVVLSRGPLARRLLAALGPRPSRPALREAYGALCDCLAAGRLFMP